MMQQAATVRAARITEKLITPTQTAPQWSCGHGMRVGHGPHDLTWHARLAPPQRSPAPQLQDPAMSAARPPNQAGAGRQARPRS